MFSRFTIDRLGDEVAAELTAANPSRGLLYRFFRKGRHDGKRAYDHGSVSALITYAVGLATSRVCEEYVERCAEADHELQALRGVLRSAETDAQRLREREQLLREFSAADNDEPWTTPTHDVPLHDSDNDAQLKGALARRRELRARKRRIARRLSLKKSVGGVRARLAAAEAAIVVAQNAVDNRAATALHLNDEYRERCTSVAQGGRLLWARYCNGFGQGYARRRRSGSGVRPPQSELTFELPRVLRSEEATSLPGRPEGRVLQKNEV